MIRVFARKTSMTPTDEWAFYDEPPMFALPPTSTVYVSVTFTWDINRGKRLAQAWQGCGREVLLGGPAFNDPGSEFVSGQFIKEGITITSRGCSKKCSFCYVPKREGKLRELEITPGYIIQDNNLLACSPNHIEKVFEMLSHQKQAAQFKGGLDIDYLNEWHIELMKQIRVSELWVACDNEAGKERLNKAADLLSDFSINKRRCYALIGLNESMEQAEKRLEYIYEKGFLPFAQLFQGKKRIEYSKEWLIVLDHIFPHHFRYSL
jgi:hypothetical protein